MSESTVEMVNFDTNGIDTAQLQEWDQTKHHE